ncbi:MAG: hypothetical protein EBZ48_11025 [Proteobacteria bacterium]|nr:hypothetical protein [Pseudomonadota bacterium]
MATFFVPFAGDKPASLDINGHRLVILSRSAASLEDGLPLVGAERIEKISVPRSKSKELEALTEIGRSANSGVVIAPPNIAMEDLIRDLEAQLPWLH